MPTFVSSYQVNFYHVISVMPTFFSSDQVNFKPIPITAAISGNSLYLFDLGASILPVVAGIPVGYRKGIDGYYYKFYNRKYNWNDAQDTCRNEGGNLAIIWNQITRDVVRSFMTEGWIGVSDQKDEGKWLTSLNEPIPYSSWRGGEPNNLKFKCGDEDCAVQLSNKLWNDVCCNFKYAFICQYMIDI